MAGLYAVGIAFTVWMGADAARRRLYRWLWLIVLSGPIGATIYYCREYGLASLPRLFLLSVRSRIAGEDLPKAAETVRRLDTSDAWRGYAALLRRQQKTASALTAAREAVARDPGSVDARFELGCCLLAARRFPEAIGELERVVREEEGFDSGKALLTLARARELDGDLAAARVDLAALAERHPRPPHLWELARIEAAAGDRKAAAATLRRLVEDAEQVPAWLRASFDPWVERSRKRIRVLSRST